MGRKREDQWLLLSVCLLVLSMFFFGVSFRKWYRQTPGESGERDWPAVSPVPGEPVTLALNPFFPAAPAEETNAPATSQFILRGVISGPSSMAILEKATDPDSSWLVKEGDILLGEKVLQISSDRVELSVEDGGTIVLEIIKDEPENDIAGISQH